MLVADLIERLREMPETAHVGVANCDSRLMVPTVTDIDQIEYVHGNVLIHLDGRHDSAVNAFAELAPLGGFVN